MCTEGTLATSALRLAVGLRAVARPSLCWATLYKVQLLRRHSHDASYTCGSLSMSSTTQKESMHGYLHTASIVRLHELVYIAREPAV